MKYLLVLTVVLVAFWIWRNNRRQEQAERQAARQSRPRTPSVPTPPLRMVACAHCGTHLPETDALASPEGFYCSEDHRRRGQRPA